MDKDLDFLKEMKVLTESLLNDSYDITKVQSLDKMIEDWIDELSGTKAKLKNGCVASAKNIA